jgi:hypothetical protein
MKKNTKKSQNSILNLSQKTYVLIIALLFGYSVYLSTSPVVKVSSDGFDTGFSALYNLALITILVPITVFLLFYRYILSNNKKPQMGAVVFYSTVYTLLAFVIQGVLGRYVFQYAVDKNYSMSDWQFFSLLVLTYLVSVLVVCGGLALTGPQAKLAARKKR